MHRLQSKVLLSLVMAMALPVTALPRAAAGEVADGNWQLTRIRGGQELTACIVKLETKDGKLTGELLASHPGFNYKLKNVSLDGKLLRITLKGPAGDETFEAQLSGTIAKSIAGSIGTETLSAAATLTATELTTLQGADLARKLPIAAMEKADKILSDAQAASNRAFTSKDPEKRAELLKRAKEANELVKRELPKLYLEVVNQHSDSPAAITAALYLIRNSAANKTDAEQVRKWAAVASAASARFGPRLERDTDRQIAMVLARVEGLEALALEHAQHAEKLLHEHVSASEQITVLNLLKGLLEKAGKADAVPAIKGRIAKLDEILDKEYLANVPSFKGTPFSGRENKSERVVVMELFTGAQCPPCVAADVAFDVLQRTYKPSELVLVQYHLHIPGPDPMTNTDTEARWQYYIKAYPGKVGGVPTALFNGGPPVVGGGPMGTAETRYNGYRNLINPLLEKTSDAKLTAKAARTQNQIAINVEVANLDNPGQNSKLRLALVEESVRYPGGNKIRFHHQVVRAMPGGAAGTALTDKNSKHSFTVNLSELRTNLDDYLTKFASEKRPFSPDLRPLDLGHLRLIAFVQDDATHEILQATQVDVSGEKNGR